MTYHITGHRSSAGGDRIRRRKRPGKALQGMVSGVVYGYGLLGFARIQGWQQLELGWPELTGMELAAAAGVRGWCGLALRCANERGNGLAERYTMRGAG